MDYLRNRTDRIDRSRRVLAWTPSLLMTADGSLGMSNLVTVPRAGNISSDTRAGRVAWSGSRTSRS